MTILLIFLLILSITVNVILFWYTRKLIQNMYFGANNIDEMQKMLNEYADLLSPLANMENYYGDPAITSAVANTRLVADACRVFKKTLIENYDEENQENEEGQEGQSQEDQEQKNYQKSQEEGGFTKNKQEAPRKAEATIGRVGP